MHVDLSRESRKLLPHYCFILPRSIIFVKIMLGFFLLIVYKIRLCGLTRCYCAFGQHLNLNRFQAISKSGGTGFSAINGPVHPTYILGVNPVIHIKLIGIGTGQLDFDGFQTQRGSLTVE